MHAAIQEIKAADINPQEFVEQKVREISDIVRDGLAISALSGGVDSSTVTLLGYRALGGRLRTYFIDNGLMRQDEPQQIASLFKKFGINVEIVDAQKRFFDALKGVTDPEEKREAITQTFYRKVFGRLVRSNGVRFLLHGTILTDVDETVAGIKRQHNIFEQIGINPEEAFGYKIIEPLVQLRKDGVRKVAAALGLPESVYNRFPFPGPALAARVIGEVTPEKVEMIRKATAIVEEELSHTKAFQYMAILHGDKVTGMRNGKRAYGNQVELRCWDSVDARTATPTRLSYDTLDRITEKIITGIPEVVSITYNITPKPPSTMEAV